MAFYINLGYKFKFSENANPDGCVMRAGSMPLHQLVRRKFKSKKACFSRKLFDPQLYYSGLQCNTSPTTCVYLSTYPWFRTNAYPAYNSSEIKQSDWAAAVEANIGSIWTGNLFETEEEIDTAVKSCIDFQVRLGCESIILPTPLTHDPGTDFSRELQWIDRGIRYAISELKTSIPLLATLAMSDLCLRFFSPRSNPLLDFILDNLGARSELSGIYLVIEQASESVETRQCSNINTLQSALHITRILSNDCNFKIVVNFLGHFGLACQAAGAAIWCSNWYKSDYRLRISDRVGAGPAFPSYWSTRLMADLHVESEFDEIVRGNRFSDIEETTTAATPLNEAARQNQAVNQVPAWEYRPSNVTACQQHFVESCCLWETQYQQDSNQVHLLSSLLAGASQNKRNFEALIQGNPDTKLQHVDGWREAFSRFRADHNL